MSAPTAARRPLFKRPTWASMTASTDSTKTPDTELAFGRQRIFEDLLEHERKEKAEKARAAKEKAAEKEAGLPTAKRRRISTEDGDSTAPTDSDRKTKSDESAEPPDQNTNNVATNNDLFENSSPPPKPKAKISKPDASKQATVITLGDDSDDEMLISKVSKTSVPEKRPKSTSKPHPGDDDFVDSDEEEDDYLRELKARARETQHLQKAARDAASKPSTASVLDVKSPTPIQIPSPSAVELKDPDKSNDGFSSTTPLSSNSKEKEDPEVQIYIKPLIPNTKALIVGRKVSQNIEPVKLFWCKKQNMSEADSTKVFFTWRGMKLYNSSTMRSVLDRLNKERKPGQDDSDGKIIVEAVTQEILDQRQMEKAQREANVTGFEDDAQEAAAAQPAPEPTKSNKFIIKLQSKDYGDMPIRIRPESTIGKIARGFVMQKAPDTTKTPYLIFDGERLEDEQTAEEIGLEEDDVVEVTFR